MLREFIAATLIMSAAASAVVAAPHRGREGRGREKAHFGRAMRQLDLSDSQREAIRALRERERESSQGAREQFRAKAREYRELKETNDPRAESLKGELKAMKETMKARHQSMRVKIDRILTDEQRQKLEQLKSRHRRSRD